MASVSLFVAVVLGFVVVHVADAGEWKVLDTDLETFDTGVDFVDDLVGYTAGDSGEGPTVYKTTDGGQTWNPSNASFGIEFMLLDIAAAGQAVVVSGVPGCVYSDDGGETFKLSYGVGGQTQSIRSFAVDGDKNFGCVHNLGVSISHDGGKTFETTEPFTFTPKRYGVYPSASTWYVTAGQWPGDNPFESESNEDGPVSSSSSASQPRRRMEWQNQDGRFDVDFAASRDQRFQHAREGVGKGNGYRAELIRTDDAGTTWTTVVAHNHTYYFNGIDCDPSDANHCCAVGEAFSIPGAGAHILCTTDGVSWNRTFFNEANSTHEFSLYEVRFSNSTYLWAVGAILTTMPNAWFLRSDDGGQSWYQGSDTLPGLYGLSLTSPSTQSSYASVDNTVLQKSGVAKYFP